MNTEIKCCEVACERPLDQEYWNAQYAAKVTGWDLGAVSPPLKRYIDTLTDKQINILIPGCGNAYEAAYLVDQGFQNITLLDIAPLLVQQLQERFKGQSQIRVIQEDFFAHEGQYDLILEQTFFCALPPAKRVEYVAHMHHLLKPEAHLVGLLFDRDFEVGPPFGGSRAEYEHLFMGAFTWETLESCKDSIAPRLGTELFFDARKQSANKLFLYALAGLTCHSCSAKVEEQVKQLPGIVQALVSTDFTRLLLVANEQPDFEALSAKVLTEDHYSIKAL